MEPVFASADRLFILVNRLVRRPRKGELPAEVPGRDGLPVLTLIGDDQEGLAEQIARALGAAEPRRVPHEFIDVDTMRREVRDDRGSDESAPDHLPPPWQRAELCRRILVRLAAEYSSARNGRDQRVRFRRFGLVNWLLEMTYTAEEPNSQHAQDMLRRLRDREIQRRPLLGFARSPSTEVALQGSVPWWAYLLGLHVLPLVWFRAWRVLGSEYRWLLRQPYMAPGDPGTFDGFALRLTQPRWGREDPVQITKLMINAFLEDLRVAYRRRPWRRRAYRRTAYCVAYLKGVSEFNDGRALVRTFAQVRNETGAFDPLLIVTSCGQSDHGHAEVLELDDELGPYETWCESLRTQGRSRTVDFWYLPVRVPAPLPESHSGLARQRVRNSAAARISVPRPPRGTGPLPIVGAALTALLLLSAGIGCTIVGERNWQEQHCGLSRSHRDADTLVRESTGECVGVAPHGYAFGSDDGSVKKTLATIAEQNTEAERIHREVPGRPLVTLVHLSALLSPAGEASGAQSYAREQLQGAASAQRRQLDRRGENDPVLRIFPAAAGSGMRHGEVVARIIERMMRTDPTIVGITGLDQSRKDTITTIGELTRVGLPMVATTLSADTLDDHSPLYYQVSPQNRREAEVAAAYAGHLADEGRLKVRRVRVVYSADPTDEYSRNLRDDAVASFSGADFRVEEQAYTPSPSSDTTASGKLGARSVGEQACHYEGLVFFAGRSEDFETILNAANDTCGSSPPVFLGGDDVARLGADPSRRGNYPRIPYEFLDFTLGSSSCKGPSDLYGTMKQLFPEECEQVENTSLDGHAALAFDAVNLYLKAVGRLQDTAPRMPITAPAVWQALSRIHGNAALDGESGRIDFGGVVDQQIPLDKLISIQRVEGTKRPAQAGFCGRWGNLPQNAWCPEPETGATRSR